MEPTPRPEWASPIAVGRHVEEFRSALPEAPTKAVLAPLVEDQNLLAFLGRHPLGRMEISESLTDSKWHGLYHPLTRTLVVNGFRFPTSYGAEFGSPDLTSVSAAGRNRIEAIQRSLYHELGHHLLDILGPGAVHEVQMLRRTGRTYPVSQRARAGPLEYFAETYAAYRFEATLADRDPEGYHMIEALLRIAWQI